jgi:hypothetical protein
LYRGRSKSLNFLELGKGDPRSMSGPPRPAFLLKKDEAPAPAPAAAAAGSGEQPRTSGRRERAKAVKFVKPPALAEDEEAPAAAPMTKQEKRRSKDDWSLPGK